MVIKFTAALVVLAFMAAGLTGCGVRGNPEAPPALTSQ
jgi:predicted small lipoprotein YifL